MPGANAPAASYAKVKSIRVSHHGFTGNTRHSLRNGFTASFVLSLVTGFLATIPGHDAEHRHQVNTSIGVPGPHDFAVRLSRARLAHNRRPPHPALHVRDDRETSLWKRR